MIEANWASSPYVHFVELDFIPGKFNSDPSEEGYRHMTCGLALALMLPFKREEELRLLADDDLPYNILKLSSIHHLTFARKVKQKLRRVLRGAGSARRSGTQAGDRG
jgi:hypothetical protein